MYSIFYFLILNKIVIPKQLNNYINLIRKDVKHV